MYFEIPENEFFLLTFYILDVFSLLFRVFFKHVESILHALHIFGQQHLLFVFWAFYSY
jgi:hypothetical protein